MATETKKALEQRTATVPVADVQTEGKKLTGFAALYGVESRDLGGFTEVIQPGAFADVLASDPDVYLTFNHSPDKVLARTVSGTLRLSDEKRGLAFEADLGDGPTAQDVREMVKRGDVSGASFRFVVADEKWQGERRTVTSIAELIDLSLATTPAYEGPSVELRSRTNDATRNEDQVSEDSKPERTETPAPQEKEERNAPEIRVTHEPAPALNVEERTSAPQFSSLSDAFAQRGFFENRTASVTWDEFRSFTWSAGTVLTDVNPVRVDGVPLGYDQRWLYPVLPTTAVDAATTSVQYLRESSRSLAAGTVVIRPLDSVTTKPETSSTVEIQTLQLNQVATISSGIPRIHAAQPMFQSVVEQDLRLAISDGLDQLVKTGVSTAGTSAAVTGNVLDKIRKAKTVVDSNGYNPDVLAIDPAGAESLDLLKSSGTEALYVFNAGAAAPAPYGLEVRVWKQAGTALLDSQAFGHMYIAPFELRLFEADAGTTNKQNVRLETNAGYAVERVSAGLRIL